MPIDRQMDRHGEANWLKSHVKANSHFLQFCKHTSTYSVFVEPAQFKIGEM